MEIKHSLSVWISTLAIGFSATYFLSAASGQENTSAPLRCSISTNKKLYKRGEVPKIQVRIKNEGEKAIYLSHSLDGSQEKMRYPYCYFEIKDSKGKRVETRVLRCGNTNPLEPESFAKVEPKATFDLSTGLHSTQLYLFAKNAKPGTYKLRFTYSTQSPDIEKWLGDGRLGQNSEKDRKLLALLQQVPKSTIRSNELTLRFRR